jgi:hypothetical protein
MIAWMPLSQHTALRAGPAGPLPPPAELPCTRTGLRVQGDCRADTSVECSALSRRERILLSISPRDLRQDLHQLHHNLHQNLESGSRQELDV